LDNFRPTNVIKRQLEPELLDNLPAKDSRAMRSRRDLRRINTCMGNARLTAAALDARSHVTPPRRLVDLGSGDGHCLLQLTRRLPALPKGLEILLVDHGGVMDERVLEAFRNRGFVPRVEQADAMEWVCSASVEPETWITANLFLHHFPDDQLGSLFGLIAGKSNLFVACEPRRSFPALTVSRLVGLIGANAVTRHDAVISVRAGFVQGELSALWPPHGKWRLHERRGGLFSHLFLAERK
jgi:hypothetical protein